MPADQKGDELDELKADEATVVEEPKVESPGLADTKIEIQTQEDATSWEEEPKASESELTPEATEPSSDESKVDVEAAKVKS